MSACRRCQDGRWVCEDHRDLPWDGTSDHPSACHCGGAGAPCPDCNVPREGEAPEFPEGTKVILDEKGWRH